MLALDCTRYNASCLLVWEMRLSSFALRVSLRLSRFHTSITDLPSAESNLATAQHLEDTPWPSQVRQTMVTYYRDGAALISPSWCMHRIGTSFGLNSTVTINGVNCPVTSQNNTRIVCTVPTGEVNRDSFTLEVPCDHSPHNQCLLPRASTVTCAW